MVLIARREIARISPGKIGSPGNGCTVVCSRSRYPRSGLRTARRLRRERGMIGKSR